jgi:hypothetical protein
MLKSLDEEIGNAQREVEKGGEYVWMSRAYLRILQLARYPLLAAGGHSQSCFPQWIWAV